MHFVLCECGSVLLVSSVGCMCHVLVRLAGLGKGQLTTNGHIFSKGASVLVPVTRAAIKFLLTTVPECLISEVLRLLK